MQICQSVTIHPLSSLRRYGQATNLPELFSTLASLGLCGFGGAAWLCGLGSLALGFGIVVGGDEPSAVIVVIDIAGRILGAAALGDWHCGGGGGWNCWVYLLSENDWTDSINSVHY